MRGPVLLAATLAAGASGACGTGGKEADVREVAGRFVAAVQRDDGATACALLTPGTRGQLEADEGEPCERAIGSVELRGRSPVRRVAVHVTSASADLEVGGTLFLDETSAGWRVSAAGCAPRPGRQPFACELEA